MKNLNIQIGDTFYDLFTNVGQKVISIDGEKVIVEDARGTRISLPAKVLLDSKSFLAGNNSR